MNTIRSGVVGLVFLAAGLLAQTPAEALARARLIEENEGNLAQAEQGYRDLLGKADLPAAVGGEAALRLGRLLWSLDRQDEARPFLQRAVASGVADVATAAQTVLDGKFDPKQDAALRARIDELLGRIRDLLQEPTGAEGGRSQAWHDAMRGAERSLLAMGDVAAASIARLLDEMTTWLLSQLSPAPDTLWAQTQIPRTYARLLWQLGTPSAVRYFEAIEKHESPLLRRVMVMPCEAAAPTMVPIALRFLADPDPDGVVPTKVQPLLRRLPLADVVKLSGSTKPSVLVNVFTVLAGRIADAQGPERSDSVRQLLPRAIEGFRHQDPALADAARSLLVALSRAQSDEARRFVLNTLAEWPDTSDLSSSPTQALDDEGLSATHAAVQKIGPFDVRDVRCRFLQGYLGHQGQPTWTASRCDQILDLMRGGYPMGSPTVQRFVDLADDAQMAAFVRLLPQQPAHLNELHRRSACGELMSAAIQEVFDRFPVPQQQGAQRSLLSVAGRSRSDETARWLDGLIDRHPDKESLASALVDLSRAGIGEPALAALRRLLVHEQTGPQARNWVFAELTRRGDPRAIAALGKAVRDCESSSWAPRGTQRLSPVAAGAGWLCNLPDQKSGGTYPWSAYGEADLERAWREILTPPENAPFVYQQISQNVQLPRAASLPLLEWLPTLCRESDHRQLSQAWSLRACLAALTRADLERDPRLPAAVTNQLANPDAAQVLIPMLSPALLRHFEPQVRTALPTLKSPVAVLWALTAAGIIPTNDEWLVAMRNEDTFSDAVAALPDRIEPPILRHLEARLQDTNVNVRTAAAAALARFLSPDSVAPLLAALRDSNETVRKAATEALERIRFYQDQTTHWSKVQRGIDVSKAAAASALVEQAGPDAPKDQRLLAIRSLGVLGAPEVLPYLIRWTEDKDADLAQAARDACARLHRTGDAPAPDAKTDK